MANHDRPPVQLGLFGQPTEPKPVAAAAVPEDLAALAVKLPPQLRLGTSSWSFPGWRDLVYDRTATTAQLARHGLAAYAKHPLLRAVGIDRSYYAPLSATDFAAYAGAVGPDFRFLVKACNACTSPVMHDSTRANDHYLDPVFATEQVVAPYVEGLGAKAGTLVFQFPPQGHPVTADPARFAQALGQFLAALPAGPRYAVELRDRALLAPATFDVLEATGVTPCLSVHPRLADVESQYRAAGSAAAGPLLIRWMLHRGLRYRQAQQRYSPFRALVDPAPETRQALARLCVRHARAGHDVLAIVNNKAEGSAPLSVFALAAAIADAIDTN